jgi:NAD(P)H-hydrate epimerase
MNVPLPASNQDTFSTTAVEPALAFAQDKDAVVVGPGLSQHPHARDFALGFVQSCPVPLLVDADALNALATNLDALARCEQPHVLTPHPGEMARLTGLTTKEVQANRETIARDFAVEHRTTLVLKGADTLVSSPGGDVFLNTTGNAGLGTGGTGDVLSGIIGALLAQGLEPTDAAILGVYAQGMAGDFAARDCTQRGMIAGDVIDRLPEAWHALEATA